ncbi:F-box protein At5g07610-like [Papaver somniferum]|uniref:F-box protein At5g07610-like n=1 Tax=Papaver somniferum TaxID=3469 RepID=UPI000E705E34|nr:F-box protein At5g07610-like [Papaver somniferum]
MSFCMSGVYWNGCLNWIASGEFVNAESSLYFDLDTELVKTLPASPDADEQSKVMYFGECGGHLYLIEHLKSWYTHYNVLKMETDYSGWKRLHKLDLQSLISMYPGIDGPFPEPRIFWRTIVFLEEDEEAESLSKLVMVVRGKEVISYDLNEMSVTKIHMFPGLYFFLDGPRGGVWSHLYHYMESLASV